MASCWQHGAAVSGGPGVHLPALVPGLFRHVAVPAVAVRIGEGNPVLLLCFRCQGASLPCFSERVRAQPFVSFRNCD